MLAVQKRETPYGPIYAPAPWGIQALCLFGAFGGSIGLGWVTSRVLGGLSEFAGAAVHAPFILVFFLGYAVWAARLQALAFGMIGRGLLRALFILLIRRKKPENVTELLPDADRMERMAVMAQRAGRSFLTVAWPIAAIAGLAALALDAERSMAARFGLVAVLCLGWGWALAWIAQRGYLPIMEEDG